MTDSKSSSEISNNAEEQFYTQLFSSFDLAKLGTVRGTQVFGFFLSSGLNKGTLSDIWDEVTQKQSGGLNLQKFTNAMKLISLAQKGIDPKIINIATNSPVPAPKMPYPSNIKPTNTASKPSGHGTISYNKYSFEKLAKKQASSQRMNNEILEQENEKLKYAIYQWKQLIVTKDEELEALEAEVDILRLENETLNDDKQDNDEIMELKKKEKELMNRLKMVEKENVNLNEECKELKIEINEIKDKYDKLYRMHNIDKRNYKNWNYNNITDWIIGLSDDYKMYENVLRNKLKEEELEGGDLGDLNKNDLDRFGIKAFKHKKSIMIEIKKLLQQNQSDADNNLIINNYEGRNDTIYIDK